MGTNLILQTIAYGTASVDLLCLIGTITSVGPPVVTAIGGVIIAETSFINHLGGNNGIQINIGRKWYTPSWMGWNSVSPKGSQNIAQLLGATKPNAKKIVGYIGFSASNEIANKSGSTVIQKSCRMLIDFYNGKTVVVGKY